MQGARHEEQEHQEIERKRDLIEGETERDMFSVIRLKSLSCIIRSPVLHATAATAGERQRLSRGGEGVWHVGARSVTLALRQDDRPSFSLCLPSLSLSLMRQTHYSAHYISISCHYLPPKLLLFLPLLRHPLSHSLALLPLYSSQDQGC